MLLLCALLSNLPSALSAATQDESKPHSCDDIHDCRTIFDIVWGCLATLFACTWLAVHPNVPPSHWGMMRRFLGRVMIMLLTLIAPEIIVFWAVRQYLFVRQITKEHSVSRSHAFFLLMGGFEDSYGTIITQMSPSIARVPIEDIVDRSKGDVLSKTVALVQTSWFVVQCLARVAQKLPITELELSTLAFTSLNFFIYFLWWDKPVDVQHPIVIPWESIVPVPPSPSDEAASSYVERGIPNIWIDALGWFNVASWTSLEYPERKGDSWMQKILSKFPLELPANRGPQVTRFRLIGLVCEVTAALVFATIHTIGSGFQFCDDSEKSLWLIACLLIINVPVEVSMFGILYSQSRTKKDVRPLGLVVGFGIIFFVEYVVARIALVAIALMSLRCLSYNIYSDVEWSAYIPHM